MKRFLLTMTIFMVAFGSMVAQDRTIHFEDGSFQEALAKAKQANQLLFIDCYTSWCGPCKMLARDVFTNNAVADYFNANFVSMKVDCEKGEGPELAKRFGVSGYPTLLFIDRDGNLVYKTMGASAPAAFLAKIKDGLNPENLLSVKEKKYADGERDRAFVLDLITSYKNIRENQKATAVSLELLKSMKEEEIVSKEMWDVVNYYFVSPCGSEWWNFILKHSDEYAKLVGRDAVIGKIGETMHPFLFGYACGARKAENKEMFGKYKTLVDQYAPKQSETLYAFLKLGESASFDKFDKYFKTVATVVPKMDQSEHYRFWVNVLKFLKPNMSEKQKQQLIELVKEDKAKSSEYFQQPFQQLLDNLAQ